MKQTFKALLLIFSLFFVSAFSAIEMRAQNNIHSNFEGTWVLDSVQVKEVVRDNIVEKTVLPSENYNLGDSWLLRFTLDANKNASYTDKKGNTTSNILYIEEGFAVTFAISPVETKVLNIQTISDRTILITHTFTTEYDSNTVNVLWKMYYHKDNK